MSNRYNKLNDYTLEVVQSLSERNPSLGSYNTQADYSLTRIFNFGTGQLTTLARHFSGISGRYSSDNGAGVASSLQMQVQDFRDLPSLHEVRLMHAELERLHGKPPPLEDLIEPPKTQVNGKSSLRKPQA
ncbi:MAG: hypothetical protein Q8K65_10540 [Alphaproteobacteria bacterium]|nr:hypothetical protein [Alphaproteobacteria bacterium]